MFSVPSSWWRSKNHCCIFKEKKPDQTHLDLKLHSAEGDSFFFVCPLHLTIPLNDTQEVFKPCLYKKQWTATLRYVYVYV